MTILKLFSTYHYYMPFNLLKLRFYNEKGFNWVLNFSTKIKIKKNTECIKKIIELKCNIELEICFETYKSRMCL